jgi:hypothetical protein
MAARLIGGPSFCVHSHGIGASFAGVAGAPTPRRTAGHPVLGSACRVRNLGGVSGGSNALTGRSPNAFPTRFQRTIPKARSILLLVLDGPRADAHSAPSASQGWAPDAFRSAWPTCDRYRPRAAPQTTDDAASALAAQSSFASARASSRSVFARAWRMAVSVGETAITRATCGSRLHAISRCRSPRVRRGGGRGLREQLERLWLRLDAARRARPTVLDEGDLAEVAVDVQPAALT